MKVMVAHNDYATRVVLWPSLSYCCLFTSSSPELLSCTVPLSLLYEKMNMRMYVYLVLKEENRVCVSLVIRSLERRPEESYFCTSVQFCFASSWDNHEWTTCGLWTASLFQMLQDSFGNSKNESGVILDASEGSFQSLMEMLNLRM